MTDLAILVSALASIFSALAAVLAWLAKLRWSQEFAAAKDETINSLFAQIFGTIANSGATKCAENRLSLNICPNHTAGQRESLGPVVSTKPRSAISGQKRLRIGPNLGMCRKFKRKGSIKAKDAQIIALRDQFQESLRGKDAQIEAMKELTSMKVREYRALRVEHRQSFVDSFT